jgi:hypothetical protein
VEFINLVFLISGWLFASTYYTLRPKRFRKNPASMWIGMLIGQTLARSTKVDEFAKEEELIQTLAQTKAMIRNIKHQENHMKNLQEAVRETALEGS